jgi:rRNA processing protein Krr1/Pno1
MKIYSPIVEYLHLQIRFNLKTRCVEIKTSDQTEDIQALQKAGKRNKIKKETFVFLLFSGFY